jgi:hypothetical protein
MATKICPGCKEPRDSEADFTWSIRGIKRHSRCNVCRAKERMGRYEKNKDAELAYKWDRQLRMREEAKAFIEEYKSTHPCVDCGKTDTRFLTFDHVRGVKKKAISDMVNLGYTIESIQAELLKCEVRCLECHHLRHH